MDDEKIRKKMAEECQVARSVDMVYLVKKFGFTPYRVGTTHRIKEHSSFTIFNSTNTFNHYSHQGEPGYSGSTIDFVMTYGKMSKRDAIHYLLDLANYDKKICVDMKYDVSEKKKLVLPEANSDHKRVFAYLNKSRGIANDVITYFLHEHRLYESKDRHNCVFVTYDKSLIPRYASMRGTYTEGNAFKGDVFGSDKSYGFPLDRNSKSDIVWVFEAPIDLMSFMSLYPSNNDNLLALGCLSLDALRKYVEKNNHIKKIGFILDNDVSAPKVVFSGKLEFQAKGYEILEHELIEKMILTNSKDVNEYLIKFNNHLEIKKNKGINL